MGRGFRIAYTTLERSRREPGRGHGGLRRPARRSATSAAAAAVAAGSRPLFVESTTGISSAERRAAAAAGRLLGIAARLDRFRSGLVLRRHGILLFEGETGWADQAE